MKENKGEQLIYACIYNHNKLIKQLLEEGEVDVNYKNIFGYTALMRACYWNHVQPVKELLKHPQINLELRDRGGDNAYDIAKENNNKEIMLLLKMHKLKQTIYNSK